MPSEPNHLFVEKMNTYTILYVLIVYYLIVLTIQLVVLYNYRNI